MDFNVGTCLICHVADETILNFMIQDQFVKQFKLVVYLLPV